MAKKTNGQRGYTLLTLVFVTALLLVTAMATIPNILTQGRREREEEMIWRGEQYVRGIRLFYMKNNRYPKSIEELTQSQLGLRFMRKVYKDPMNGEDGSWRLIYVGPLAVLSNDSSLWITSLGDIASWMAERNQTLGESFGK